MMFSTQHLLKERLADLHREGERQRLARSVARASRHRLVVEAEGVRGGARGRVLGRPTEGRARIALEIVEGSVRDLTDSLYLAGLSESRIAVRVEVEPRDP